MNEIERILKQMNKERINTFGNGYMDRDLAIIKAGLIKAAFTAVVDGNLALQVCAHVEREMKNVK